MKLAFPGETAEYRTARDALLDQEIALRRQMEAVAAARRALPLGGPVPEDYVFDAGDANGIGTLKLSELFAGKPALLIYSMMFPRHRTDARPKPAAGDTAQLPVEESPCPSCTALLDQLEGAAEHVSRNLSFVVVAKAPISRLLAFAKDRGWRHLRLVSSASNRYNRDYHGESAEGAQQPMLNAFSWEGGAIRHSWASEMLFAPADAGQDPRHVGTLEPLWNLFDFTREGRPETWEEQLQYEGCARCG